MKQLNATLFALTLVSLGGSAFAQTTTRITTGTSGWSNPTTDKSGKKLLYTQGGMTIFHNLKNGYATVVAEGVSSPFLSPGGNVLVFEADSDPLGTNDDGNPEVFLVNLSKRLTLQITDTANTATSSSASVDKYGKRVVFLSDADLVPGSNADLNTEVFLYTVSSGVFTQVTDTTGPVQNRNPRISATGKVVVYDSDSDPLTTNADGNVELFRYSVGTLLTTQLTNTTSGDNSRASLSADGRFVAFESDSSDLAGANVDGLDEIYRLDTAHATFLRITDSADAAQRPSISGTGAFVAFQSDGDLVTGSNPDNSDEIFLSSIAAGVSTLSQITSGAVGTSSRSANCDHLAKRIYFRSDADLTGQGAGDDHVFLYVR